MYIHGQMEVRVEPVAGRGVNIEQEQNRFNRHGRNGSNNLHAQGKQGWDGEGGRVDEYIDINM